MIRALREYRLIPIVLIAVGCLFALKALGIVFDGGYTLGQRLNRGETLTVTTVPASSAVPLQSQTTPLEIASAQPPAGQRSWMQEMFNYPDVTGTVASRGTARDATVVTGSVNTKKEQPKAGAQQQPPQAQPPEVSAASAGPSEPGRPTSAAERAILERLHQRRQELDARAREIELRENLLKAAEKKVEERIAELKAVEERIAVGQKKKDEAEAARFKGIVTMYETMKPRDAAKIFDRLESRVLIEVATQINPRRMSEIMAQMSPEAAEKLTVELAARANGSSRIPNPSELPKIEGVPGGG